MVTQDTIIMYIWAPLIALFIYIILKLISNFRL